MSRATLTVMAASAPCTGYRQRTGRIAFELPAMSAEERKEEAQHYVELELERLDVLLVALQPKIRRGIVPAITEARRISESRRKLLALDAPVKSQSVVEEDHEIVMRWMTPAEAAASEGKTLKQLEADMAARPALPPLGGTTGAGGEV